MSLLLQINKVHVLDCCKYFGSRKSGCVFGETIIDNDTNNGFSIWHTITSIGVNNEVAIDTVEESKKNFTMRDQLKASRVRRFQHVAASHSNNILYND